MTAWDRLLHSPATARRTYGLNMLAGGSSALTMVALQLFTTRILGAEAAGRVSVDAATVLLCFQVGDLQMRSVQATDLSGRFSFSEYLTLKTCTASLMTALCLAYVLFRGYDGARAFFCLGFGAFKALETLSDCFWGMLHSRGRLDLSALGGTTYQIGGILAFGIGLLLTRRLDLAAAVMALTGAAVLLLYTWPLGRRVERPRLSGQWPRIGRLAAVLIPLFAANGLLNMAIVLPKYVLERSVSDVVQGHFAALYMTAQGVLLLSAFLYYPQLTALAGYYTAGDRAGFRRLLLRLGGLIALLDLAIVAGGWLCGPELLGWLFHLDLTPYRPDLMLILGGGGFFALYTMLSYGLVAMRRQRGMWLVPLVGLVVAGLLDLLWVPEMGLRGAAWGYLVTMGVVALLIALRTVWGLGTWGNGPGEAGREDGKCHR